MTCCAFGAFWWRQAGKRMKDSSLAETAVSCGKNEGRRTVEETRGAGGGEGAHYVSVISRIRRVFSICSKAPLMRAASLFSSRGKRRAEKDAARKGERIARNGGGGRGRKKRRRKERDSCEEEKPGACNLRAHHTSQPGRLGRRRRQKKKRDREKERGETHVFCGEG